MVLTGPQIVLEKICFSVCVLFMPVQETTKFKWSLNLYPVVFKIKMLLVLWTIRLDSPSAPAVMETLGLPSSEGATCP